MKRITITSILTLCSAVLLPAQSSYTLQQCKDMARENNAAVIIGQNNILMAEEQKKEALIKYFPSVSAAGGTFRSDGDLISADVDMSGVQQAMGMMPQQLLAMIPAEVMAMIPSSLHIGLLDEGTMVGVTAVQPLYAGGRIVNGNRLARLGVEASEAEYERTLQEVDRRTAQYFWQIAALEEKLVTVGTVQRSLDKIAGDVRVAVDAGVALGNDLLQVELKQSEMLSTRMKVENGIKVLKLLLAQHAGLEDADYEIVAQMDAGLTGAGILDLRRDHDEALARTPEYRLLEMNVQSKKLQYKMEVGKNLPSVGVGAGYSYVDVLNHDRGVGMIFATVSVPISDWWGGSHSIRRKRLEHSNAQRQLQDSGSLLLIGMQNAWDGVENAWRQLDLAERTIAQAEENLRIQSDCYKVGTITISDLLGAQMTYQQARDSYVEAFSDLQMKILEYRQSTGQQ